MYFVLFVTQIDTNEKFKNFKKYKMPILYSTKL